MADAVFLLCFNNNVDNFITEDSKVDLSPRILLCKIKLIRDTITCKNN